MVMKLVKALCCMFLFSFLVLTLHKSCLLHTEKLTNRNMLVTYFMHSE